MSPWRVFEIYIKTTPERLWQAITDPEMRAKYNFGVEVHSDWAPGSRYLASVPGAGIEITEGENLEVDPPHRLVQTFRALWSEDVKAAGFSRVTWEITPVGDSCRHVMVHDRLSVDAMPELHAVRLVSGLKMLLDRTGEFSAPGRTAHSE